MCVFYAVFPYVFPLQVENGVYKAFHAAGAVFFHLFGEVAVSVQGKSGCSMAKISLQGFNIIPGTNGIYCIGVPLWYNRKKRGSPYFTRGCAVCRCEISPFPALKWQRKICPGKEVCYANTKKQAKTGTE